MVIATHAATAISTGDKRTINEKAAMASRACLNARLAGALGATSNETKGRSYNETRRGMAVKC